MSQERRRFIPREEGDTQVTEAEIESAKSGSKTKKVLRTAIAAGGAILMAESAVAQQPKKQAPKAEMTKGEKSESKSSKITDSLIEKIPAEQKQKLESLKAELKELEKSNSDLEKNITVFLYRNRLFSETPDGRVELERRKKNYVNFEETQKVAEFLDEVYRSLGGLDDQIKNANEYAALTPRQQYAGNVLTARYFSGPRLEKEGITISEAIKLYYQDLAKMHDEFKKLSSQIDVTDAVKRIR